MALMCLLNVLPTLTIRDNMQQGVCKRTQHVKVMLYETVRNDDCLRNTALQHCCGIVSNGYIAALCCAKNRCCKWSCFCLHGAIHVPQHLLYSHHAPSEIFLYVCRTESKKNPMLPCGLGLKAFPFSFFFFDNDYWNSCMLLTKGESRSLDTTQALSKAKGWSGE